MPMTIKENRCTLGINVTIAVASGIKRIASVKIAELSLIHI